jgi:hypothetical protein
MKTKQALLTGLTAFVLTLPFMVSAQDTLLNDTFSDGSRTDQNLPGSAAWYYGTSTTNPTCAVVAGELVTSRTTNTTVGSVQLTAFFTPSGFPKVLVNPGSYITLSFKFISPNTNATAADLLRFGLFSSGGNRISADLPVANGADAKFNNWKGYSAWVGVGGSGTAAATLRERTAANTTLFASGANTTIQTLAATAPVPTNTYVTGTLTLSNTIAGLVYSGGIGSYTFSGTDATPTATSFDSVAFFISTALFQTNGFRFDDVKVTAFEADGPPYIIVQPPDVSAGAGNNATFSVVADGTPKPLYYNWYQTPSSLISASTNSSLILSNVTLGMAGNQYFVVVTNTFGSVTSSVATLTEVVDVSSPTVAYWRFEPAFALGYDYSTNGIDLTDFGLPASYALPASSGQGAYFSKNIPLTGSTNTAAVLLDGASGFSRSSGATVAVSGQMTIEAYFNITQIQANNTMPIAARWVVNASGSGRSWFFGPRPPGPETTNAFLRFGASPDGVSNGWIVEANDFSLVPNHDYYAAAVFNAGTITVYFADLEAPEVVLQSQTFTNNTVTNILYEAGSDFRVGFFKNTATSEVAFKGVVDEVRYSRVALSPQQLLIPAPLTGVPTGLAAIPGNAQIALSWQSVSNATAYNLKRSLINGGPYTVVTSVAGTNYVDTGLTNGTTYYYVVSATGVGGESADSSQVSSVPVAPAQPVILPPYIDGTGTNLVISANTVVGPDYVLETTAGLEGTPVWTPVFTNAGSGGVITNLVPVISTNPHQFFRYLVR